MISFYFLFYEGWEGGQKIQNSDYVIIDCPLPPNFFASEATKILSTIEILSIKDKMD